MCCSCSASWSPSSRDLADGDPRTSHESQPAAQHPIIPISTLTALQIRAGLQNLPQELYDEIFSLTFTHNSSQILLNKDYKPPVQLQVSRQTRKDFIKHYYGETRLIVKDWADIYFTTSQYLGTWLNRLSEDAMEALISKDAGKLWAEETLDEGRDVESWQFFSETIGRHTHKKPRETEWLCDVQYLDIQNKSRREQLQYGPRMAEVREIERL